MEKFRIAQYGFIQMVALAYGMICSGLVEKGRRIMEEQGTQTSLALRIEYFYHDYGIFLTAIIIIWAVGCAFHASIFSHWNFGERQIVMSGLGLTALFFLSGTGMFLYGLVAILR